jgi:hypothetical protein
MTPSEVELYWLEVGAIGQVLGAAATFLAVVASLFIALRVNKPRLRFRASSMLIIGDHAAQDLNVAAFSVVNQGDRPVHIRGIGWHTGEMRWGPKFLRRQSAVQIAGGVPYGRVPPYEIQAGEEISSYALMTNLIEYSEERKASPFFTRDWPLGLGRRPTRVRAYVYTADGHEFRAIPAKDFLSKLFEAEQRALLKPDEPAPDPGN